MKTLYLGLKNFGTGIILGILFGFLWILKLASLILLVPPLLVTAVTLGPESELYQTLLGYDKRTDIFGYFSKNFLYGRTEDIIYGFAIGAMLSVVIIIQVINLVS